MKIMDKLLLKINYLLVILSFFMPINQKVSTLLIVLIVILSLFNIKNARYVNVYLPFFVLYLLYTIGYYRDMLSFGIIMFEQKASLLAFPIIFMSLKVDNERLNNILMYFVYGCFVSCILSFIVAFYHSVSFNPFSLSFIVEKLRTETANLPLILTSNFMGNNFSYAMNGSYLSIYFAFSIGIIWYLKDRFHSKFRILATVIFILSATLIFSVMGMLCCLFAILVSYKRCFMKSGLLIVLTCFLISSIFIFLNRDKILVNDNTGVISKIQKLDNRVYIWSTAMEVIEDNFLFGVGVKQAQKELDKKYPKAGKFGFDSQVKKLDAHNQFYQILIETGIFGFVFILILGMTIYKYTKDNFLVNLFVCLFLFLSLSESTLSVYVGVSFLAFFYCLFVSNALHKKHLNTM
jgi:O-antigen ligase